MQQTTLITLNPTDIENMISSAVAKALASFQGNPNAPGEIIDREELMKRLGISHMTVIKMEKKGKLPVIHVGNSVRYDWQKVIRALEKK